MRWLVFAAIAPLAAIGVAHAQAMKGLAPGETATIATTRALDLRLAHEQGVERPGSLVRGLLVHHGVTPNAVVGVGLANIYARRRSGADMRIGERPPRSRRPAVTFVMRF